MTELNNILDRIKSSHKLELQLVVGELDTVLSGLSGAELLKKHKKVLQDIDNNKFKYAANADDIKIVFSQRINDYKKSKQAKLDYKSPEENILKKKGKEDVKASSDTIKKHKNPLDDTDAKKPNKKKKGFIKNPLKKIDDKKVEKEKKGAEYYKNPLDSLKPKEKSKKEKEKSKKNWEKTNIWKQREELKDSLKAKKENKAKEAYSKAGEPKEKKKLFGKDSVSEEKAKKLKKSMDKLGDKIKKFVSKKDKEEGTEGEKSEKSNKILKTRERLKTKLENSEGLDDKDFKTIEPILVKLAKKETEDATIIEEPTLNKESDKDGNPNSNESEEVGSKKETKKITGDQDKFPEVEFEVVKNEEEKPKEEKADTTSESADTQKQDAETSNEDLYQLSKDLGLFDDEKYNVEMESKDRKKKYQEKVVNFHKERWEKLSDDKAEAYKKSILKERDSVLDKLVIDKEKALLKKHVDKHSYDNKQNQKVIKETPIKIAGQNIVVERVQYSEGQDGAPPSISTSTEVKLPDGTIEIGKRKNNKLHGDDCTRVKNYKNSYGKEYNTTYQGKFENGSFVEGKILDLDDNVISEGKFEDGVLIEGKKMTGSGWEEGKFELSKKHKSSYLLEGTRYDSAKNILQEGMFSKLGDSEARTLVEGKETWQNQGVIYEGKFKKQGQTTFGNLSEGKRTGDIEMIEPGATYEGKFENYKLVDGKITHEDGSIDMIGEGIVLLPSRANKYDNIDIGKMIKVQSGGKIDGTKLLLGQNWQIVKQDDKNADNIILELYKSTGTGDFKVLRSQDKQVSLDEEEYNKIFAGGGVLKAGMMVK